MILSVTELNEYARKLIATDPFIQNISVKGEVSNLKKYYNGHYYFTLKDEDSNINCVMFAQYISEDSLAIENGSFIEVFGSAGLYSKTGQFQFYVTKVKTSGRGNLFLAFENLKNKLFKKGLFDVAHKKTLSKFPQTIGVISSPQGSVIHDIINVLNQRNPNVTILLYPTRVQGLGTSEEVIKGIRFFNKKQNVDSIIIARGGGSFEDLFEFNSEDLAYAIFDSEIPIISAVGHETDFTIADFVADMRAATPSHAAELISCDIGSLNFKYQYLDEQLNRVLKHYFKEKNDALQTLSVKLKSISPLHLINEKENKLKILRLELSSQIKDLFSSYQNKVDIYKSQLEHLNPLNILKRGFVSVEQDNKIITSSKTLQANNKIRLKFYDGTIEAIVND